MYQFYQKAGKAWEVKKLWKVADKLPLTYIPVEKFIKQDVYWNIGTFRDYAEEFKRVLQADYSYPVLIGEDDEIIDGAHRIVHAYLDGVETLKAVVLHEKDFPKPYYDENKAVRNETCKP